MKIGLIFIGAIRENIELIPQNIQILKQCFADHNVSVILSTWAPEKKTFIFDNKNYVYDYDFNEFTKYTKDIVDYSVILKQRNLNDYVNLKNGCKPIFLYHLNEIANYLNDNDIKFDYIVKTRHDMLFELHNTNNYLNECYNILPYHYNNGVPTHYTENAYNSNDHFFITSYNNFMKFSMLTDEKIIKLAQESWDNEHINYLTLKNMSDINYIEWIDVKKYIVRNNRTYVI